jgi:hypothetical protein
MAVIAADVREIPLAPYPVRMTVPIRGRIYSLATQYREALYGGWVLDVGDGLTGERLVSGIPLVTGADLLEQYQHLAFGFHLVVYTEDGRDQPTYDSLGVADRLVVYVPR